MTDDELHDAVLGNPAARALADRGDDAGAALAVAATLPRVAVPGTHLTEAGVLRVLGPVQGDLALAALEAAAQGSRLLARAVRRIQGETGLDFGDSATRMQLDQLQVAGVLAPSWVAALKAVAERSATVEPGQVSRAWARYRPDGKIVPIVR